MTPRAIDDLPIWRRNALRGCYLLLGLGLGAVVWPGVVHHDRPWGLPQGVLHCMLAALSALALLGLRHPARMLPLLVFEIAWKALWLSVVALPSALAHRLDTDTLETAYECLLAVIFVAVTPWRQVVARWVTAPAEPWRRGSNVVASRPVVRSA